MNPISAFLLLSGPTNPPSVLGGLEVSVVDDPIDVDGQPAPTVIAESAIVAIEQPGPEVVPEAPVSSAEVVDDPVVVKVPGSVKVIVD